MQEFSRLAQWEQVRSVLGVFEELLYLITIYDEYSVELEFSLKMSRKNKGLAYSLFILFLLLLIKTTKSTAQAGGPGSFKKKNIPTRTSWASLFLKTPLPPHPHSRLSRLM
jgi:hypothetical protein